MTKRRFISLLPGCNQTADLTAFFGATVDALFQPGISDSINGYIGHQISGADPTTDFYLAEPDQTRAFYQLEPGMVSLNSTSNTIRNALTYPDFISYLDDTGAIVSNQQRLFDTALYSWAPPINIDAWMNYRQYYWFGDGAEDMPVLAINVPITYYTGDGVTTLFALPPSMTSITLAQETPTGYVAGETMPTTLSPDGSSLIFADAPALGTVVMVTRIADFIGTVTNMTSIDVTGLTSNDTTPSRAPSPPVTQLSSGMLLRIYDTLHLTEGWGGPAWDTTPWDAAAFDQYIIDGVGQSIRFTPYGTLIRGLAAQYVTIDRSSQQTNAWSSRNLWVHRATFLWAGVDFVSRQALRPIIEFVRDLVLWQCSASLYKPTPQQGSTLTFAGTLPVATTVKGFDVEIGVTSETLTTPIPVVTVITTASTAVTLATPLPALLGPFAAGTSMTFQQIWSEDVAPLFMLYDLSTTPAPLNDPVRYPNSTFYGDHIFGYALGTGAADPVILQPLVFDSNGIIVYDNAIATTQYLAGSTPIIGLYRYATHSSAGDPQYYSPWHDAGITSQSIAINGFWDIPVNLQANPLAQEVSRVSNSDVQQHFADLISQQSNFSGTASASNNYRDSPRDLSLGTQVLQHRATLLKAMLLASSSQFDLTLALRYADQEYNRFRNKFARKLVDLCNRGVLRVDIDPASTWVATTLAALKIGHTNAMPFWLSTMAGGQWFIPPTASALGIQPAVVPALLVDALYNPPITFIQGHDGSRTPANNDWRDAIILALEQLIYTNLDPALQTEARPVFDIQQWCGGHFYAPANGYSHAEVSSLLAPFFEIWAQNNGLDYRNALGYDPSNPFTWNYRGSLDLFGLPMAGSWRAVYHDYYGTDAPHLRPWEMLGFQTQPSWWVTQYGAPPYTPSNRVWIDATNGYIAGGVRAGYDAVYSRPGLLAVLPVDATGHLRDPTQIGLVTVTSGLVALSSQPWQAGDFGPVEMLWRTTPSFQYALACVSFLMKPARFTDTCWTTLTRGLIADQWVDLNTLLRSTDSTNLLHGESDAAGQPVMVTGVSQWLADYLVSQGGTSSQLGDAVRGLDVRLLHQMAGFVSSNTVQAVCDSFGLLPAENVQTILYTSPPNDTEVYSGVIVEWTGAGWRVIGYDGRTPSFTIIPPDPASVKGVISLASVAEPKISPWQASTWYALNTYCNSQGSVYQCQRSHTSGPIFELSFWTPRPDLSPFAIPAPRIVTYATGFKALQQVAYGTIFNTYQAVGDFLLGYERYLVSRGWIFSGTDPQSGAILNWSMAALEFLSWTQVKWQPGNFIALSPGQRQIQFSTLTGTINNVEDNSTGFFGLCDRVGAPISQNNVLLSRLDGDLTITALNADIFLARLYLSTIEHLLVFDNVTIFDDAIYLPLFNLRQPRLQLICNRAQQWSGRLDAPGFVITGNTLASSFEKAANDVRYMFDIELADVADLRDYARHVIGYAERNYLDNLLLAEVEQFEFYQGMIQQKGAPGVFEKLMRSTRASGNSTLSFLEEWGFQVGQYGAPADGFVTFQLAQTDTRDDPQFVSFQPLANAPLNWIMLAPGDPRWYDVPPNPSQFFTMQSGFVPAALPIAGPVRLTDVANTVFAWADVPTVFSQELQAGTATLPAGERLWVYERADLTFTVLESFNTAALPNALLSVLAPVIGSTDRTATQTTRLTLSQPLNLQQSDIGSYIVIDAPSLSYPDLHGVATLIAINFANNTIDIDSVSTQGYVYLPTDTAPMVRILREMRFPDLATLMVAGYDWMIGDLAWIDGSATMPWTVQQWDGGEWSLARQQPLRNNPTTISETLIYAAGTQITGMLMSSNTPVVNAIDVIDPVAGLIAGRARKELDYLTPFDPARYNAGATSAALNPWGPNERGRVWWNIATVKFIDPSTDVLGASNDRDVVELHYRIQQWTRVAPLSSVDVYEWIESLVDPTTYIAQAITDSSLGRVYLTDAPSWVERVVYDPTLGDVLKYYFWVSGLTVVPVVSFRSLSVATVIQAITYPSSAGLAWMAPISSNGLLISGVASALDDSSTVMKVQQHTIRDLAERHDQWALMRPNDPSSLPSAYLWQHLRDSLTGFTVDLQGMRSLPSGTLPAQRNVGIQSGQNMFQISGMLGARGGLLDARQNFVDAVNAIFAQTPICVQRTAVLPSLTRYDAPSATLQWTQTDASYPVEPPPVGAWMVQVYSMAERDNLLARADFLGAGNLLPGIVAPISQTMTVLVNSLTSFVPHWSIWTFDGVAANRASASFQQANSTATPAEIIAFLLLNADAFFALAPTYEVQVASETVRDSLATLSLGDRVLVLPPTGFWAIWTYQGAGQPFSLLRTQRYHLILAAADDSASDVFLSYADYYASGYSVNDPPVIHYATIAARNIGEGTQPVNQLVVVDDAGTGGFIWTQFDPTSASWTTVAIENGTIQLAKALYDPDRVPETPTWLAPGAELLAPSDVTLRDGSWELRSLLDALRYANVLKDSEINTLWFNMVDFVHAQQSNVDWAFKTSFMSILGYNVPLLETPFTRVDQTVNLIDFVNEVKPYRVKIREYATSYTPPTDIAPTLATDFDKPVYWDQRLGVYRVLDPANLTDIAILQTQPWVNWYTNYLAIIAAMAAAGTAASALASANGGTAQQIALAVSTAENTVAATALDRQVTVTLLFDRVVGSAAAGGWDVATWDTKPWDNTTDEANDQSGAVHRIASYYQPSAGMPTDLGQLLNLQFKGGWVDGFIFNANDYPVSNYPTSGWDTLGISETSQVALTVSGDRFATVETTVVNPSLPGQPREYGLRDPALEAEHPEERIGYAADDGLQLIVTSLANAGAPPIEIKRFDLPAFTGTQTFSFATMAQSAAAVLVHCNGLRATLGTDYTVDHFGRTVTINATLQTSPVTRVVLHVFGFGGLTPVTDSQFLSSGVNALSIAQATLASNVAVIVNGVVLSSGYQVNGTSVTLSVPPSVGSDVALISYLPVYSDYPVTDPVSGIVTYQQELVCPGGAALATTVQQQVLAFNSGLQWTLTIADPVTMPPHAGTIIEVSGVRLTPPQTFYGLITPATPWMYLPIAPTSSADRLTVYYNNVLYTAAIPICTLSSSPSTHPLNIVVPVGQTPSTMIAGQFVVYGNLLVALETQAFDPYQIAAVVSLAGQTPDYTVSNTGVVTLDADFLTSKTLPFLGRPINSLDTIVATTFSNAGSMQIRTSSYPVTGLNSHQTYLLPASVAPNMMLVTMNGLTLVPDDDYHIVTKLATVPYVTLTLPALAIADQTSGFVVMMTFSALPATPTLHYQYATRTPSVLRMAPVLDQSFDYRLRSPYYAGRLDSDLPGNATSIVVDLNTQPLAAKLQPADPLPLPLGNRPGVIWIDAERIEYFAAVRVGNQITLGHLRRGTLGTSVGPVRLLSTGLSPGGATIYVVNTLGAVDVRINSILQPASSYNVSTSGLITSVTVTAPIHATVVVGVTNAASHLAGSVVYAGNLPYRIPALRVPLIFPIGRDPFGVYGSGIAGTIIIPSVSRTTGILGVSATGIAMDQAVSIVRDPNIPYTDNILGYLPLGSFK